MYCKNCGKLLEEGDKFCLSLIHILSEEVYRYLLQFADAHENSR